MSPDADTKVCPLCAETIKAAAKKCPFCQTRQTWFAVWGIEVFMVAWILAVIGVAVLGAWIIGLGDAGGGRPFVGSRGELHISGAALIPGKKPAMFWLTGSVTNRGDYPWRVEELEIRFLDAGTNLVDAQQPHMEKTFVVQPHSERAFRVELGTAVSTNRIATIQARVQVATDGNRDAKPD